MRICLITPGQPSNNPRLVKEADALTEAGYDVHAICADCGLWPSRMDRELMANRKWTYSYVGNALNWAGILRRSRHKIARTLTPRILSGSSAKQAAISPVAPELAAAARRYRADLYIAHHVVALPAAVNAAREFDAKAGCDIEDLWTEPSESNSPLELLLQEVEREYLPQCHYTTAASPGFAMEYGNRYGIPIPEVLLNVFPLSERPQTRRRSEPGTPLKLYWFSQCIGEKRGLEDIVAALGLLRDCTIELHLRGNWQNGYRERLQMFAESVGAAWRSVISHAPGVPDEMARLASVCDVGLALEHPVDRSHDLCLSNKLFVYLLAGNAFIATRTTGQNLAARTIDDAGFSYAPGDFRRLAEILREWYFDRDSLNRAREAAWEWSAARYNWDVEKERFLRIVADVLETEAPAGVRHTLRVNAR